MTLPQDLAPALTDGVVLCHLANHIKPRSVASIHVPSPAVVSKNISLFNLEIILLKFSNSEFLPDIRTCKFKTKKL